jgi:hypothetical protein
MFFHSYRVEAPDLGAQVERLEHVGGTLNWPYPKLQTSCLLPFLEAKVGTKRSTVEMACEPRHGMNVRVPAVAPPPHCKWNEIGLRQRLPVHGHRSLLFAIIARRDPTMRERLRQIQVAVFDPD